MLKVNVEQLLFEVAAEDFGDILAELKATHAGLAKLLGGVAKNVRIRSFQYILKSFHNCCRFIPLSNSEM